MKGLARRPDGNLIIRTNAEVRNLVAQPNIMCDTKVNSMAGLDMLKNGRRSRYKESIFGPIDRTPTGCSFQVYLEEHAGSRSSGQRIAGTLQEA